MGREGRISLDPRLSAVADLVGSCTRYADVGCDHGRLGAFLLQSGRCASAVLSDISEPSLAKARRLMDDLGLTGRVAFRVADGIPEAADGPFEAVVIAGMGGSTVARILREGKERLNGARLITQPNVAAPELRAALCACGYAISRERVAQDGRRCYVIIEAVPGEADYGPKELIVGPALLRELPGELLPYARFRHRVAEKALAGAQASGDEAQAAPLQYETDVWEEVLSCLAR